MWLTYRIRYLVTYGKWSISFVWLWFIRCCFNFVCHFLMEHNLSQTPYWHKTYVIQSQLNSFLMIIRICLHKTLMLNINLRNAVKWKFIENDYHSVMCPDLSMKTYFLQDYCSSIGAYLSRIETKDENDWIVDTILPDMNQGKCW